MQFLLFVLFFTSPLHFPTGCSCHRLDSDKATETRIFGGDFAEEAEFPFQLNLRYDGQFICGAVLVDRNGALTAAHCFNRDRDVSRFTLVGGTDTILRRPTEQVRNVKEIVVHPEYACETQKNDIAYIRVQGDDFKLDAVTNTIQIHNETTYLPFEPGFVARINENSGLGANTSFTVMATGWGRTEHFFLSGDLKKVNLTIVSNDICRHMYNRTSNWPNKIFDTMICAGDSEGRRDTCKGDSGGPLIYRTGPPKAHQDILIGLTSWGPVNCSDSEFPGVYTRVSKFAGWIERQRFGKKRNAEKANGLSRKLMKVIQEVRKIQKRLDSQISSAETGANGTMGSELRDVQKQLLDLGSEIILDSSQTDSATRAAFLNERDKECPYHPHHDRLDDNGTTSESISAFMYTLSIQRPAKKHQCGGFIIDPVRRVALSAAHCFWPLLAIDPSSANWTLALSEYRVVAGELNFGQMDGFEQFLHITKLFIHPHFNDTTFDNDIAYIVLDDVVISPCVGPVSIPSEGQVIDLIAGRTGVTSGWGQLTEKNRRFSKLEQVHQQLAHHGNCRSAYLSEYVEPRLVSDSMICAVPAEVGRGACRGFGGAPMVIHEGGRPLAVGISSWGSMTGCGKSRRWPEVLTSVQHFVPWIHEMNRIVDEATH